MNDILSKIRALVVSDQKSEARISKYIIENHFDLSSHSATSMAKDLAMSDSSIIRYAKRLGCTGFPDLKLKLAAFASQISTTTDIVGSLSNRDSTDVVIAKTKQLFNEQIDRSMDLLSAQTIDELAKILSQSRKVVLAGIGASALVANDIHHKLTRLNLNVHFNRDYHTQMMQAALLQDGDVLLVISARGNTKEMVAAAQLARENQALVIAITRYGSNKLAQEAQFLIPYLHTEQHENFGMVTPQLLQMIAFDVLYFRLVNLVGTDPIIKTRRAVEKIQEA